MTGGRVWIVLAEEQQCLRGDLSGVEVERVIDRCRNTTQDETVNPRCLRSGEGGRMSSSEAPADHGKGTSSGRTQAQVDVTPCRLGGIRVEPVTFRMVVAEDDRSHDQNLAVGPIDTSTR